MKILIILSFLVTVSAHAEESKKGERFAKMKEMALQRIEAQMSHLQQNKSCVSSASSREDMKKCRQEAKAHRQKMKEGFKARRAEFKSSRKSQ